MDPAKREALRRAGGVLGGFVAERWSWTRFAKVMVVLVGILVVGTWLLGGLSNSWLRPISFQTERTEVTVTGVGDPGAEGCGRNATGERHEISWPEGGATRTGWFLACGAAEERGVGDTFTAWPTDGERAYDWPSGEVWRWMLPILGVFAFVITLIGGTRLPGEEEAADARSEA